MKLIEWHKEWNENENDFLEARRADIFVETRIKKNFQAPSGATYFAHGNTYTQIYIHIMFAVEGRQNLIAPEHNDELQNSLLASSPARNKN
jgi:hypothetical protein